MVRGRGKWHFEIWSPRIQLDLVKWHFQIWSQKIQLDLKLPNLPTFHFTGWGGGKELHFEIKSPRITLQNLPTFYFNGGGGGAVALINQKSNPKIQLDLKLPNLPTFHLTGVRVRWEGVGKWHFEIWSQKIQLDLRILNLPTFHFTFWVEVGLWNLKSKNPTWLETSKTSNFLFCWEGVGGWGGQANFEISSPGIQLDLKLPNLPTFHFTRWGWREAPF